MIPNINHLIFDGVDLERFGVVPTALNVDAAPVREFTVKSVPGRNGDIIIDKERFSNINISYSCYISDNFKNNFSALKSFLLSKKGYCRLEDTYDPDHYREGYYAASIEPDLTADYKGGKFELTFNCKPQRFLKSGEYAVSFEAGPSETGFILDGYSLYEYAYRDLSTDSPVIYNKAMSYAIGGIGCPTEYVKGLFFIIPAGTTGRFKIKLTDPTGASDGTGVNTWRIRGENYYSMRSNGHVRGTTWDIDLSDPEEWDLLVCVAADSGTMDAVTINNVVVYSVGSTYARQIINPTEYTAKPFIKFYDIPTGSGAMLAEIGGQTIKLSAVNYDTVYIDCNNMYIYSYDDQGNILNLSNLVTFVDWIELQPGVTDLLINPTVKVDVTPRWWEI